MDLNMLLTIATLFGIVIAIPGAIVSGLLLKDRWYKTKKN